MNDGGYVYIITNKSRMVFYIGVTSDILQRIYDHKQGTGSKFTAKYNCKYLVYYEWIPDIGFAIDREKQLKNWHRDWKINLIKSVNPTMKDLYDELWGDPETSSPKESYGQDDASCRQSHRMTFKSMLIIKLIFLSHPMTIEQHHFLHSLY